MTAPIDPERRRQATIGFIARTTDLPEAVIKLAEVETIDAVSAALEAFMDLHEHIARDRLVNAVHAVVGSISTHRLREEQSR